MWTKKYNQYNLRSYKQQTYYINQIEGAKSIQQHSIDLHQVVETHELNRELWVHSAQDELP